MHPFVRDVRVFLLRLSPAAVTFALGVLCGLPALAQGRPIFSWIDANGALHATQLLAEVPEPFYSIYRVRMDAVAQAQRAAAQSGQDVRSPPSQAAVVPQVVASGGGVPNGALATAEARMRWRAQALQARHALVDATAALQAAEDARAEAARNPLLNFTPAVQARVRAADAAVEAARKQAVQARRRLLTDLPEQARKAGVPPAWLLP